MGKQSRESIDAFLESLKQAGVKITNETELRERLFEARMWHQAFLTLASNGQPLGICFEEAAPAVDETQLHRTFARHEFTPAAESLFAERLKAAH